MRKIIVSEFVTLDGVMEAPENGSDTLQLQLLDTKIFRKGVVLLCYQKA